MLSLSYLLKYASFLGLTNAACNYGTLEFPREAQVPASKFSYDGLTGPLNWYGLNTTANAMCDHGTNQSPITINALGTGASNGTSKTEGTAVSFSVPPYPAGAVFENLGTNVEVVVNGSLVDAGKNFSLAQFHFHTPSEHRINDEYFPMEMHFVFQAADASTAVVAFVIEFGPTDPLLASIFAAVSEIAKPGNTTLTGPLDFTLLQYHLAHNAVYRYTGSLTTPPCSENVAWIISAKPLYVDVDNYKAVKSVVHFNARYTQDVLGLENLLENAADELGGKRKRMVTVVG